MTSHRKLYFLLQKLDSDENVIEEKSVELISGKVDVGSGGTRRKASFDLLEPLAADWQANRWKLHYGYSERDAEDPQYVPLGVFIPINPSEAESQSGKITSMQGADKSKLYSDYELDSPVTFPNGTAVRDIITTVASWFGETKLNLESALGVIAADLSFEEGTTAEQILNTVVTSFSADWYYDANGYLVALKNTDPATRAISYVIDDAESPLYITASKDIDDSNYYNRVTVVGGLTDTPIYRATYQDDDAIARAGGRIVQKYFTVDAAVTQDQVNGRAAYYLSQGVQLPSQLKLTSLVLPELEIGNILQKGQQRFEVRAFSVPLSLSAQDITAGEIIV